MIRRGDVTVVAMRGPYTGKPRPAVVVQSDAFNETHASVSLCPLSTELHEAPLFRVTIEPTAGNGLRERSQAMTDKVFAAPRARLGEPLGSLSADDIARVDAALRRWLDL